MKKTIILILFIFANLNLFGQTMKRYIKRDTFTKVVSIDSISNHGDDILTVNVFFEMGKEIPWGDSESIISYRYLGVDNNNNLRIQRKQEDDSCILIFALDSDNTGKITLIGQRSQRKPLLIELSVICNNNQIRTNYLGNLRQIE